MARRPAPAIALRIAGIIAAALLLATLAPRAALGDGDPASDVLLGENVFYPYAPPVTAALTRTLNAETAAAARAGFGIKVALIGSPVDLGVIPDLFGKPQKYATFLDQEISFRTKQPLLVVMSTGYGVEGLPPRAQSAVSTLPKPSGKTSNDLATAAIAAVTKLAAAAGHPIPNLCRAARLERRRVERCPRGGARGRRPGHRRLPGLHHRPSPAGGGQSRVLAGGRRRASPSGDARPAGRGAPTRRQGRRTPGASRAAPGSSRTRSSVSWTLPDPSGRRCKTRARGSEATHSAS